MIEKCWVVFFLVLKMSGWQLLQSSSQVCGLLGKMAGGVPIQSDSSTMHFFTLCKIGQSRLAGRGRAVRAGAGRVGGGGGVIKRSPVVLNATAAQQAAYYCSLASSSNTL